MSSGSTPAPVAVLLNGIYTLNGNQIKFSAINGSPERGVAIVFENGPWEEIHKVDGGNGYLFYVTPKSFQDFKSRVFDKNVQWNAVLSSKKEVLIPGTWSPNQANVGGIRRARSSKSSKPTKRRRSRRVYRKTKKN